jgi:plastocyanin
MKKLLPKTAFIFTGLLFVSLANATTHVVTVQNFSFNPSSFTAVVGDTVEWEWVGGGHTTTSTTIPGGASAWSNPMNNSNTTFKYKITAAGTYNYWCAIHTTSMEASFTVTAAAGVSSISGSSQEIAKFYPNPVSSMLNIHLNVAPNNNILIIMDVSGREIVRKTLYSADYIIDVSAWKRGIYLYEMKNETETIEGKFEVE